MPPIAFIAGTYQPDRCGVAHYTRHLRETLAEQGIQSTVLTTHEAAQAASDPTVQGVIDRWHINHLVSLVKAIHATKAEILHIQHAAGTYGFDRAIFLLPLLLRMSQWHQPIVTTVHEYGWWEWQPKYIPASTLEWLKTWGQTQGWWDREDGFLLTQSNALITTNTDAEQVIASRLPHLVSRVHRIPIAANVESVYPDRLQAKQALCQRYGWSTDDLIVVFFGFLHPVKGIESLLDAFQQVLAVHPTAKLLLLGGVESLALQGEAADRYWNQLQAKIAELQLQDGVQMTGYLEAEAVSQCLAGADLGVLPFNHGVTLKSGSLLALMAHRLPVIATQASPADPDITTHLVQLIEPRNRDALAAALIQMLTQPDLRARLANAGYAFSRQFSWSQITQSHLKIYRSLLKSPTFISSEFAA
ncbi:MAG TPA: glycosyltransferase family 4 protein [Trichocoleus sp.]|jgi:glycosyltransferase involved in cell wall biosynthesis